MKPRRAKNPFDLSIALRPQEQIDARRDYYIALGRFINTFADIEAHVLITLSAYAGLDEKTAKALFSGVRIEQASDFLRRLGAARKMPKSVFAELHEVLLPQIKAITELRNDIIHYGVRFKADKLTVDNQRGVGRTQVRRYTVSAKLLDNARSDLVHIWYRMLAATYGGDLSSFSPPIQKALYSAWRYKPRVKRQKHPQSGRRSSGRAKAKALPRPLPASHE